MQSIDRASFPSLSSGPRLAAKLPCRPTSASSSKSTSLSIRRLVEQPGLGLREGPRGSPSMRSSFPVRRDPVKCDLDASRRQESPQRREAVTELPQVSFATSRIQSGSAVHQDKVAARSPSPKKSLKEPQKCLNLGLVRSLVLTRHSQTTGAATQEGERNGRDLGDAGAVRGQQETLRSSRKVVHLLRQRVQELVDCQNHRWRRHLRDDLRQKPLLNTVCRHPRRGEMSESLADPQQVGTAGLCQSTTTSKGSLQPKPCSHQVEHPVTSAYRAGREYSS